MPRVSRAETERNHEAIEVAASHLLRERGFGVSLADLMAGAGMTHGGFYKHFDSKDSLVDVACRRAFEASAATWKERLTSSKSSDAQLRALVDGYLAAPNRSDPGNGCPLVGMAADVSREPVDKPVRQSFAHGLDTLLEILIRAQPRRRSKAARGRALAQLCTLAGAVLLARATRNKPISDELLLSARREVLVHDDVTHRHAETTRRDTLAKSAIPMKLAKGKRRQERHQ
jgi:TetR/AcrR family transcriptional repressor of nem operon